jgi:hypothetical protein
MKKLRQFEIDAICDEAYKLVKEEKEKQVQPTFDEFEEKESLLESVDKFHEIEQQIKKLKEEQNKLSDSINKTKETLRQKGVLFNVVYNDEKYHISFENTYEIYHDIRREIILHGIDDGSSVRDFIKELVDKFK